MSELENTKANNPEATELFLGKVLRIGVLLSAITISLGMLLFLIRADSGYPGSAFPKTPVEIVQGLLSLKPYAVMLTGLLLLILTPVFRVGLSIIAFAKEKDYLYTAITSVVFIILLISFLLGKTE